MCTIGAQDRPAHVDTLAVEAPFVLSIGHDWNFALQRNL